MIREIDSSGRSRFASRQNNQANNDSIWTAGQRRYKEKESEFVWKPYTPLGLEQAMEYTNWSPGEPNFRRHSDGEKESCLSLQIGGDNGGQDVSVSWNDDRCSQEKIFVCELNV